MAILREGLPGLQRTQPDPDSSEQHENPMAAGPKSASEVYFSGVARSGNELEGQLTSIRAAMAAGEISVRQAAEKRIAAMEFHLTECRRLGERYAG